jgi:hypothetical protein
MRKQIYYAFSFFFLIQTDLLRIFIFLFNSMNRLGSADIDHVIIDIFIRGEVKTHLLCQRVFHRIVFINELF